MRIDHKFWRNAGVDLEARLWGITTQIAAGMAARESGVVPQDDAKTAVSLASHVLSEYVENVQPKQEQFDIEAIRKAFQK